MIGVLVGCGRIVVLYRKVLLVLFKFRGPYWQEDCVTSAVITWIAVVAVEK